MKRNIIRGSVYALVLSATTVGVFAATRKPVKAAVPAGGHDHRAMNGAAPDAARPVMLSPADERRIGLTLARAEIGSIAREIRTVGQVTVDETRVQSISPKIEGWVDRLYVNVTGQPIAAGQPMLTLYSPMLVSAQEELLLAMRLQHDVANASEDARQNAADLLSAARRRLAYWDISPEQIADIERTGTVQKSLTLRAPAGGYVLEKSVLSGQRIMAGDALYKIADLRTVWVDGEVFEQDIASIRVGQAVHADFDALPGEHRMGRISYIYPTLDPQTRTVRVRVVVANDDLRLKPGMYATLRIAGAERAGVLTVPRSAVLATGERTIVFVHGADGMLTPRPVTLGAANDERVEVLSGLTAGETVVSSATFLVDAESNLGSALNGMAGVPGMDHSSPARK